MEARTVLLDQDWYWKERGDPTRFPTVVDEVMRSPPNIVTGAGTGGWTIAKSFPSEIHVELLNEGLIPDPFVGFNEHEVQWVGERDWLYYTTFDCDINAGKDKTHILVFEGLDSICDVYLNGVKILFADNMFRTYTSSTTSESNTLLLHFQSAKLRAKMLEQQYGRVRAGSTNLGDPSRVYVRKAQYDWRWDWAPEIMTCGPYRSIKHIVFDARIESVHTHAIVSAAPELTRPFRVDVTIGGEESLVDSICVSLKDINGQTILEERVCVQNVRTTTVKLYKGIVRWDLSDAVQLWWPVGYGKQHLYDVQVSLLTKDHTLLDTHTQRIGFRTVKLVQEPIYEADRHGKGSTFLFEVNGVRMFIGGSNWIPAHNFLTQVRPEDYRAWLTLLRDGNQNMVRLWGGGVYEPDCFYDICDELGILVWQDFQFACGVYPAHEEFVANVRKEAEDNVQRLRRHPSMALFCGNNEGAPPSPILALMPLIVASDYQQVLQWGDVSDLPARLIYEQVLPAVVSELCDPPIPYHPGSPYGGQGWDTADPTIGDIHQWDIWAGKERPWQEYAFRNGRFVSEFGVPSFPDVRTVDYWLAGDTKERWAQSKLMSQHNRAGNHERRFAIVMNENFRLTGDLETHIYNTQIMQSEAVGLAYRSWRREWRGKGREYTAGALVWQLNDCWPVVSWSIVDFFRRPKPAYYTIARELRPITVGIIRTVTQNRDNDRPKQFYEFGAFRSVGATVEVWGTNSTLNPCAVRLELRCFDLLSDWTHTELREAVLLPNQTTELLAIPCPCPPTSENAKSAVTTSHSVVVGARLIAPESGEVLARYADWPQPFRHVDFPDPALRVEVAGQTVSVHVDKPVKGLFLTAVTNEDQIGEPLRWTDNALDVLPGDPQIVELRVGNGDHIVTLRAAYMGCERGIVVYDRSNNRATCW
ncbi:glycoside hydrolase family 2 protein [Trametes sanguinea]|nr:glycoside hydrolase family 2 protein [Trametes sanguinea]